MFRDVSKCFGIGNLGHYMKWHAPPKWARWTCHTSYKCLEPVITHFIENPRLKVVWFQDVSRCFEMFRDRKSGSLWNDTRHQNDPGEPAPPNKARWTCHTSYKCLETHFIENPRRKASGCFKMFRDGKSGPLWNDTRHQNDPGEPVIQATNVWEPIS